MVKLKPGWGRVTPPPLLILNNAYKSNKTHYNSEECHYVIVDSAYQIFQVFNSIEL